MKISPLAGKPAEQNLLVNIPRLVTAYYSGKPDPSDTAEKVSFGTSGHRGSSFKNSFNENHILAITQAICHYRKEQKTDGLYILVLIHMHCQHLLMLPQWRYWQRIRLM